MNAFLYLRKYSFQIVLASAWGVFLIFLIPPVLPTETVLKFKAPEIESRFGIIKNNFTKTLKAGDQGRRVEEFYVTPFVTIIEFWQFEKNEDGQIKLLQPPNESVRFEYINVMAVAIILIVTSFTALFIKVMQKPASTSSSPSTEAFIHQLDNSVDQALLIEVRNAWLTAQRFYGGSLYLLVSGVLMAFVGMGVFVFTITDPEKNSNVWKYVFAALRPFGLLIFIEAIAWFLLRQYRSSTEDFKNFHRIYLRRSNYLIARKALAEINSFEKSRTIAKELLSEDLSGRLSEGQTTEAIEAMRMDENNPVFKVLTDALSRVAGKEKSENKDGKEKEKGKAKGSD